MVMTERRDRPIQVFSSLEA